MTGVAQQTAKTAGPLLAADADQLSPLLLLVLLLCWIVAMLVILQLTQPRSRLADGRRASRPSPRPRSPDAWSEGLWLTPEGGPPEGGANRPQGWRVADRVHQVPVQVVAPASASHRPDTLVDRAAADMLDDVAGPVLSAGRRRYRRTWGGVLLHGTDLREAAELAAGLRSAYGVPLLVVRAHDVVPVDQHPIVAPVFALAATMAPCVLLIEGVDELADPTAPLVISRHARRIEHELASAMRFNDPENGVVVVASARSRDAVAPTLLQDGCLDRMIAVGTPTLRQRHLLILSELLQRRATFDGALDEALRLTNGMTQHRIVEAVHEACRTARRRDPTTEPLRVSLIDLRAALCRPSGVGPLAFGPEREARICELTQLASDPTASFGFVLAGEDGNGGADVARWVATRARRTVAWLDAGELCAVPVEQLEQMVAAACSELPVLAVFDRLDALLAGEVDDGRRRKSVLAIVEHLAQTSGSAVLATMRRPELIAPRLVEDGTVEVMWLPAPDYHDRVALVTHQLRHAILADTTAEEVAAALHGATRAQVVARCQGAIRAAALRDETGRSSTLEVVRADFGQPSARRR